MLDLFRAPAEAFGLQILREEESNLLSKSDVGSRMGPVNLGVNVLEACCPRPFDFAGCCTPSVPRTASNSIAFWGVDWNAGLAKASWTTESSPLRSWVSLVKGIPHLTTKAPTHQRGIATL